VMCDDNKDNSRQTARAGVPSIDRAGSLDQRNSGQPVNFYATMAPPPSKEPFCLVDPQASPCKMEEDTSVSNSIYETKKMKKPISEKSKSGSSVHRVS
jgi:hypothetical protein